MATATDVMDEGLLEGTKKLVDVRTFPTKSWVLVSLPSCLGSVAGPDEVASWMMASMSSLVGIDGGLGEGAEARVAGLAMDRS
jgi:hypothetical protein